MACTTPFLQRAAILGSFLLLLVAVWVPQAPAQVDSEPDAVVYVQGMACENCARWMKKKLSKLEAVAHAEVLLDEQKVLLTFKEGETVTTEALQTAVEDAGYKFRKVVFADDKANASGTSETG